MYFTYQLNCEIIIYIGGFMFAIVTGATGGLGRSFVFECAKRGYDLLLSATNQQRLDVLKDEVKEKFPNIKVYAKDCKLDVKESREEFYGYIKSLETMPNVLICNAGYILEGSVLGCDLEEVQSCINVNVAGNTELLYWFLTNREKTVKNYCLIVSSMAGYYPMPQMATYGATKAYLTNMAVSLRQELKRDNVNIVAVCPGGMATSDAMKRSIKSQGIGGRLSLVSTEKIAHTGIKKMLKNKAVWVPGFFNKIMILCSKIFSKILIASFVGKRWVKCEKKRGEYR